MVKIGDKITVSVSNYNQFGILEVVKVNGIVE